MDTSYATRIQDVQQWLGINNRQLAHALGTDTVTLSRWKQGTIPRHKSRRPIEALFAIYQQIHQELPDETQRKQWLAARISRLGGLTRLNIILAGRTDRLAEDMNSLRVVDV